MGIGQEGQVRPVDEEDVEGALYMLERMDRDAANLLRNYLRALRSRVEALEEILDRDDNGD